MQLFMFSALDSFSCIFYYCGKEILFTWIYNKNVLIEELNKYRSNTDW